MVRKASNAWVLDIGTLAALSSFGAKSVKHGLVVGDHTCVSDLQNSLILIADEFLYPGIILAEVTNVGFRQKFPVGGKDGHR
jgi:hypothetical protein